MYTYPFLIFVDLGHVSIQDSNYKALLDIFGSNISNLEFTVLNLALATKVKRNKTKYLIYYKSPTKVSECIKSPLISIYGHEHNRYKSLTKNKNYFTIGNDNVLLITDKHVRYLLDQIKSYIEN